MRFGTDGLRGVANQELTPELVLSLGRAAAPVLGAATVVVGRDTRRSGPMLEAALAAGFASAGVDVELLGIAPTPAVAWRCATTGVAGAVISASHNPFADNGVKLFAPGGRKLPDDVEERIEAGLSAPPDGERPVGAGVGVVRTAAGWLDGYVDAVVASLEGRRLDGLSVVLDCGHGAAAVTAPQVFRRLGADVTVLHDDWDGTDINDGVGSTHPEALATAVRERGADAGLAFDGDADRVVAVGGDGRVVDGDAVLALLAADRQDRGDLRGGTLVVTVMANLGLRRAMAQRGVAVTETAVGDRYVLEALDAGGFSLGGEPSGHVIFRDLATTGDGVLTGAHLLDVAVRAGRPLGVLAAEAMTPMPQVLRNVRVAPGEREAAVDRLAPAVARAEAELGERGRVLVRPSGTEPLVRVMVEADDAALAEAVAQSLVDAVSPAPSGTSGSSGPSGLRR